MGSSSLPKSNWGPLQWECADLASGPPGKSLASILDYSADFVTGDSSSIPGLGRSPGVGIAVHSSILAWRIPWTEARGGYKEGYKELDTTEWLSVHIAYLFYCSFSAFQSLYRSSLHFQNRLQSSSFSLRWFFLSTLHLDNIYIHFRFQIKYLFLNELSPDS